jgi:hypothetical protein
MPIQELFTTIQLIANQPNLQESNISREAVTTLAQVKTPNSREITIDSDKHTICIPTDFEGSITITGSKNKTPNQAPAQAVNQPSAQPPVPTFVPTPQSSQPQYNPSQNIIQPQFPYNGFNQDPSAGQQQFGQPGSNQLYTPSGINGNGQSGMATFGVQFKF